MQTRKDGRLVNQANCVMGLALAAFTAGAAMLLADPNRTTMPSVVATILTEASVVALIVVLIGRDLVCRRAWRFSLRALLLTTSFVAVVLGLIVWAAH